MSSVQLDSGTGAVLELASVVGGTANTTIFIGNNNYGVSVRNQDNDIVSGETFVDITLPPYPVKIANGGNVTTWSASFEANAAVGVDLSQLDPLGLLGLKTPAIHAQLYHIPGPSASPSQLDQVTYNLVDEISLGEIPTIGSNQAYTGGKGSLSFPVARGDYFVVRFFIDSNLVSSLTGVHAQAFINID